MTGASTGIGRATARHLKGLGFDVRAGVRKEADAEALRSEDGLEPVMIDVTDVDSIAAAAGSLPAELYGLVNNAGVAVNAPLEFIPLDELRNQLEVNLIGQVAVIQALLARVRAARGRVVNVSSVGGRVALPLFGPYAASKFGLEAVSDSLRREVRGQGVKVIVIQPGGTATPIWDRGTANAERIGADMPPEARELYGALEDSLREEFGKASTSGVPPERVAKQIGRALTVSRPRTRYPARDTRAMVTLQSVLGDRAFDAILARRFKG